MKAIILLTILALLLAVPICSGLFFGDKEAQENRENRFMADFPEVHLLKRDPALFITNFEKFLNDRIGFRASANLLYRRLKYYVLKDPPLYNIAIGDDNCVFMLTHRLDWPNLTIDNLCGQQVNPAAEIVEQIDHIFTEVDQVYSAMNIDVTIAIAPTTFGIYADKLPQTVSREYREGCSAYEQNNNLLFQLRKKSEQSGHYKLYYPYELFKEHRDEPYFYPSDSFHWVGKSAFLFARDLLWRLGMTEQLKTDDPAEVVVVGDDLARFFGFTRQIKAMSYPYREFQTSETTPGWIKEIFSHGTAKRFVTKNSFSKRTGLLVSNSFGEEVAQHLAKGFKDFYFIDINFLKKEEEHDFFLNVVNKVKPDNIFVLFDDAGVIAVPERLQAFNDLAREQHPKFATQYQTPATPAGIGNDFKPD